MTVEYAALQQVLGHWFEVFHPGGRREAARILARNRYTALHWGQLVRSDIERICQQHPSLARRAETTAFMSVLHRISELFEKRNRILRYGGRTYPGINPQLCRN